MSTVESTPGLPSGDFGEKLRPLVEAGQLPPAVAVHAIALNGLKDASGARPGSILAGGTPEVHVYEPMSPNLALQEREAAEQRSAKNAANGRYF